MRTRLLLLLDEQRVHFDHHVVDLRFGRVVVLRREAERAVRWVEVELCLFQLRADKSSTVDLFINLNFLNLRFP